MEHMIEWTLRAVMEHSSGSAAQPAAAQEFVFPDDDDGPYDSPFDVDLSQVLMQDIIEQDLLASSYSSTALDSAVPQPIVSGDDYLLALYNNTVCWHCDRSITIRWWTTLLAPVAHLSDRPMCSAVCLLEYLGEFYCPHPALESRLRDRMWAQLCKAWKDGANTTEESAGGAMDTKSDTSDRQSNSLSSAEQPASHSARAQPLSVIPREVLLPIVRFVGAHNLETIWSCSECNPYWYDWSCDECLKDTGHTACWSSGRFLRWSPSSHYGCCGDRCRCCHMCECCRSENRDVFPCEFCEDLRNLKGTCRTMQDLVKTYDATSQLCQGRNKSAEAFAASHRASE